MPAALRAILIAAFLAGVLDYAFVVVFYGSAGTGAYGQVFINTAKGIAGGLLGTKKVASGGNEMVGLGLALHFLIALGAAVAFYALSRAWRFLVHHWVIGGAIFGVGVWLFMQLVVLRYLSTNPPKSFPPAGWEPVFAAHVLCVGWPVAWATRRFAK